MILYFLRHAEAEPDDTNDAARPLTEKGLAQAERAAKFLQRNGLFPEIILTSPLVRARQTAKPAAKRFDESELSQADWLACGMTSETFLAEIGKYQNLQSILLVGHEPDFSTVIAALIGLADPASIRVRKGSLTVVELPEIAFGKGRLHFSLPSKLM